MLCERTMTDWLAPCYRFAGFCFFFFFFFGFFVCLFCTGFLYYSFCVISVFNLFVLIGSAGGIVGGYLFVMLTVCRKLMFVRNIFL